MQLIGSFMPTDGGMSFLAVNGEIPGSSPLLAVLGLLGIIALAVVSAWSRVGFPEKFKLPPLKPSSSQNRSQRLKERYRVFNRKY
jgi:hypothetical protein